MDNNGKDTSYRRHIDRRLNSKRNDKKNKMGKIYWCEGGLKLADIATNNVGDNYLNNRIKYITVRLEN